MCSEGGHVAEDLCAIWQHCIWMQSFEGVESGDVANVEAAGRATGDTAYQGNMLQYLSHLHNPLTQYIHMHKNNYTTRHNTIQPNMAHRQTCPSRKRVRIPSPWRRQVATGRPPHPITEIKPVTETLQAAAASLI